MNAAIEDYLETAEQRRVCGQDGRSLGALIVGVILGVVRSPESVRVSPYRFDDRASRMEY